MSAEELLAHKRKCFDNLGTFYIEYILPLQNEEILFSFPDYPADFPDELRFKTALEKKIKQEKIVESKIKNNTKKATSHGSTRKSIIEKKANEFNKKSKSKRSTRFSGSYNFEENKTKVDQSSSASFAGNKKVQSQVFPPNKIAVKLKKTNKTLSDSSSSDDSDYEDENSRTKCQLNQSTDLSFKENLSDSSDDEDNANQSKKVDSSQNFKDKIVKIPSVKNQKTPNTTSISRQLEKQRGSQINKLKAAFEKASTFDDAMKIYSNEVEKSKPAPPVIIPAPLRDPMMKLKKKIYKNQLLNAHLGGIFTINNGWDKDTYDGKNVVNVQNKNVIPISQRCITPPPNHIQNYNHDDDENDLINSSYDYRINDLNENMEDKGNDTDTEDEEEPSELVISEKMNNSDDMASVSTIELQLSKNTSQEIDHEELDEEIRTTAKNPKKIRKISSSEDENEKEQLIKDAEDDDAISLGADYSTLDDFEDNEPPNLHVELDDLKMKFKIERSKKQIIQPEESPKEAFDKNTKEIIEYAVDPKTDNILRKYFGNVCPAYLENRCSLEVCNKRHEHTDIAVVRAHLIRATTSEVRDVFEVVLRFFRLFHDYATVFTEKFINNNDVQSLINQIKGCDRHVRTRDCLRDIARKIIDMGYMNVHKAIKFIIQHHSDSTIARDTILHLILDSGPCIPYFMDYIETMYNQHTICTEDFNRILQACVTYQNPMLPNFCLNYLIHCTPDRFETIPKESLAKFLSMNKCISELNENLEAKLLSVVAKMNHS